MFVVFTKQAANMLIKKGFILREIGGNKENIYYFDDSILYCTIWEKVIM